MDLVYNILKNIMLLDGFDPESNTFKIVQAILDNRLLQFWGSPEKTFFLSYVLLELTINRSLFSFTKLIKYNIIALFSLLMIQSLIIALWDLIFNRAVSNVADELGFFTMDTELAINVFLITFYVFILIYIYFYVQGLKGKFAQLPFADWFNDSVAFSLRIRTKTMRIGRKNTGLDQLKEEEEREENEGKRKKAEVERKELEEKKEEERKQKAEEKIKKEEEKKKKKKNKQKKKKKECENEETDEDEEETLGET